jgi:CheY-like chemotaxis protein
VRCGEADTIENGIAQLSGADHFGDPYQVALVDLSLPGMDVAQFVEKVKACNFKVPVNLILLTRYDQRSSDQPALDAGFKAFLVKPIKRFQLFEKLGEVVTGLAETAEFAEMAEEGQPVLTEAVNEEQTESTKPAVPDVILLVEDNPANQKLGMAQLRKLGYRGDLASDGKQAVEAVLHHPERYIMVLMDTQMPEMDGLEATRIIRQAETMSGGHIPIIALTASALEEDADACLTAGMNEVYTKPINLEQLRTAIEKWKKSSSGATLPGEKVHSFNSELTLDSSILAEIRGLQMEGEPDLLAELIEAFQKNSKKLMGQISSSFTARDGNLLRRAAHSLKGSSGNLGASRLAEMCGEVEVLAERGELDAISPMLPTVEAEYQKALSALIEEKNESH